MKTLITKSNKDSLIIYSDATNYGTLDRLEITSVTADPIQSWRGLVNFDLSAIRGGLVDTATMEIYYYSHGASYTTTQTLYAAKITQSGWTEAGVNWTTYNGSNAWTAAGGDYVTTNPAQASVSVTTTTGVWISLDVKAIVQDAISNASGSVNILLYRNTGILSNDGILFHSSDYTTDTSLIPKLTLTYQPARSQGFII